MSSAKVEVTVLPYRAVVIDGALVEAGQKVSVSSAEAKALVAEAYAEKAK